MGIELIGVPFDGYGREGHQARAASVLREAGLVQALEPHGVRDTGDLELPAFETERGVHAGLVNEPALEAMTALLHDRVAESMGAEGFPVVVGGDCSLLLGVASGLRTGLGETGLVFFDGHEDAMPLDVVEDGEAANCEVGLLLGVTGGLLRGPLREHVPALDRQGLAMLGQRDADWRRRFNVASLAGLGVWSRPLEELRQDPTASAREAVAHVRRRTPRWWLHVDLDVLDPEVFPAQGLPDHPDEPGGLGWPELTAAMEAAIASGGCAGLSVTIYDPDQDPDGSGATATVRLIENTLTAYGTEPGMGG